MLRPGFHVAAFFVHRSSGNDTILIAKRQFILLCVSAQRGIFFCCFHSFHCDICASSQKFNPIFFFFNFTCAYLFIGVFHEGNVTVLVAIGVRTASLCIFFIGASVVGFFLCLHFHRFCWAGFSSLYFLYVWTMKRSILRGVARILLSCSFVCVQVQKHNSPSA